MTCGACTKKFMPLWGPQIQFQNCLRNSTLDHPLVLWQSKILSLFAKYVLRGKNAHLLVNDSPTHLCIQIYIMHMSQQLKTRIWSFVTTTPQRLPTGMFEYHDQQTSSQPFFFTKIQQKFCKLMFCSYVKIYLLIYNNKARSAFPTGGWDARKCQYITISGSINFNLRSMALQLQVNRCAQIRSYLVYRKYGG
jgi:hypothetical protein